LPASAFQRRASLLLSLSAVGQAGVFSLFRSMPEHKVRRHCQLEIREDDFSLTSPDACAPSQASGVKILYRQDFSLFKAINDFANWIGCKRIKNVDRIRWIPLGIVTIVYIVAEAEK
jgi:hypothetical protein